MSDLPKSNAELDAVIGGANTHEALREAMLQTLAKQGQIVRSRDDEFNNRLIRQPNSERGVPLPASGFKFEREVRFAESTGKRALVIRANSLEDLNALERQVTGQ